MNGNQLETVVLELQWKDERHLHAIHRLVGVWQQELQTVDRQLHIEILIIEHDFNDINGIRNNRQVLRLPWWNYEDHKNNAFAAADPVGPPLAVTRS